MNVRTSILIIAILELIAETRRNEEKETHESWRMLVHVSHKEIKDIFHVIINVLRYLSLTNDQKF